MSPELRGRSIEELIAPLIAKNMAGHEPAREVDYSLFWSHVDRDPDPQGHWLWTGAKDRQGYGVWMRGQKKDLAHRLSWELVYQERPQGYLKSKCGLRHCVNPLHKRLARPG